MGLEVRDVRAGYGRVEVLHGVDVTIPAGATVAVVGPNGAGKSTLLRCIAGLLPVRSGIVEWSGRDITNRSAYDRAADGMVLVPDGHNVFTALTVRENLTLFSQGQPIRCRHRYIPSACRVARTSCRNAFGRGTSDGRVVAPASALRSVRAPG